MAHKGLNLDVVVKAAAELIEQQGRDAFSMRLLAEQLGIKTASLYNHVDNMEMLLAEVCRYGLCLQNAGHGGKAWRRCRTPAGRHIQKLCEKTSGAILADHGHVGKR